LASKRRS